MPGPQMWWQVMAGFVGLAVTWTAFELGVLALVGAAMRTSTDKDDD